MARLYVVSRAVLLGSLCCAVWGCDPDDERPGADAGPPDARAVADAAPDADAQALEDGAAAPGPAECEVTAPTTCPDPSPRYADVKPIFAQYCAGCHNGRDGMWPLSTYQHVADWYGEIRGQLLVCTMPPPASGVVLPRAERERILTWIRCGFPN